MLTHFFMCPYQCGFFSSKFFFLHFQILHITEFQGTPLEDYSMGRHIYLLAFSFQVLPLLGFIPFFLPLGPHKTVFSYSGYLCPSDT